MCFIDKTLINIQGILYCSGSHTFFSATLREVKILLATHSSSAHTKSQFLTPYPSQHAFARFYVPPSKGTHVLV